MANMIVVTADYGTVITTTGSSKIAACILNGTKLNITHAAVGDGGGAYYIPTAGQTKLMQECWRGEIASYEINDNNPNMLDVKFIVPAEVGGFTIREAALLDEAGDVVAICNTPDAQKVKITDGVSFPITMVMHIVVTDVSAVQVVVNSSLDTLNREELNLALAKFADEVGSVILRELTIPAAAWVPCQLVGRYGYTASVSVQEASEKHFPVMALGIPSLEIASAAGLCPTIQTLDGIVQFWAVDAPGEDLSGQILLRSENLFEVQFPALGSCDHEVATDEEVQETMDGVFGPGGSGAGSSAGSVEIATDQEVEEVIHDVFSEESL